MEKTESINVRLTPELSRLLHDVAEENGLSNSMLVRNMIANCRHFYKYLEMEKIMEDPGMVNLENDVRDFIFETVPDSITPQEMHFLAGMMSRAADAKAKAKQNKK